MPPPRSIRTLVISCFALSSCASALAQTQAGYGEIPYGFEENRGQLPAEAKYFLRGGKLNLFVTNTGVVLSLHRGADHAAIRMEFGGWNANAMAEGLSPVAAKSNYLLGNDPAKWITGAPQFDRVRIREIRRGLDLVWYANERQIEYDLVLKPGASASGIRLRFAGAQNVSLTVAGDLKIETAAGNLIQHRPNLWQRSGETRAAVAGGYRIGKTGDVSVIVGPYDHSRELVIDPVIVYSTYLGGKVDDRASAIAVNAQGNAYITGQTSSVDFPTTVGAYNVAENGTSTDTFVTKLNPSGTALVYSTYIGGANADYGNSIAIDSSGNAYITGMTYSADFPVTAGALQTVKSSESSSADAFVAKLNASGTGLLYSTYLGGPNPNYFGSTGQCVAVDATGNAYIGGQTSSSFFPVTKGAYQSRLPGPSSAFISKLNPAGTQLVYSTYLGGSSSDSVSGIALDSSRNAYVVGTAQSSNFPTTANAYQTATSNNSPSVFVAAISADGSTLNASTYLSSSKINSSYRDYGVAITLDSNNSVYVTGSTASSSFPTTMGAFATSPSVCNSCSSSDHAFVTKLNSALSALTYSSYLGGGSGFDVGTAIAVDSAGNAYVTGFTTSTDFPITPGSLFAKKNTQYANVFLSQFTADGSALTYSAFIEGTGAEFASGVAVDGNHGVYVAGYTSSKDFPVTSGAYQTVATDQAPNDIWTNIAFVTKLDTGSPVTCNLSISPASLAAASAVGGPSSLTITVPQGCPWLIVNGNASAITINGPSHGIGNATVNFTVAPNTSYSPVSASLFIGASTFTVTQPARSCSMPLLVPSTSSFGSTGGLNKISVTLPIGCPYAANSSAPWVSVTAGATGNGSGSVSYFVDRNDFASRSAVLTIANTNFTITQTGAGCTATAVENGGTGGSGGTGIINVTTSASTCVWKAYSLAPWVQLLTTLGTGSANVGFVVAPNPGVVSRTGLVQIAGQTVTVSEAAGPFGQPAAYTISTIAGTDAQSFSGDGGPGRSATLSYPSAVAFDSSGNLFIADENNFRIRKLGVDGNINTIAGNGTFGSTGDGGPALSATMWNPTGVAVDSVGSVYLTDLSGNIRKVAGGVINTVASGVNATSLTADSGSNVFFGTDGFITKLSPDGSLAVVAGSGDGFSGDGGSPLAAKIGLVTGIALDSSFNLYFSDDFNQRIRKVGGNLITTVAGNGNSGFNGVQTGVTSSLSNPRGLAADAFGNIVIADSTNGRIRRLSPDGNLVTIAGNGWNTSYNPTADGTPALSVPLSPLYVAIDQFGNIAFSDSGSVIRLLTPAYSFCSFTVSDTGGSVSAAAGTVNPSVTTTAGCVWNTFSSVNWITVPTPGGNGSGPVTLQVAANTSGSTRMGTVNIAGQTYTVTQSGPLSQSITFSAINNVSFGAAPFVVSATASSGFLVKLASNTPAVCAVSGATITILSSGGCSITATQPGDASYAAAPAVTQNFTVFFTDVPSNAYYYAAVNLLAQKGITAGCGNNSYCATQNVTRAQMAIFMVRAVEGGDTFTSSPTPYFTDVQPGDLGFKWIQKMYELGITAGCSTGKYCPNDPVTRDQMAIFMIRTRLGVNLAGATPTFSYPAAASFTDVPTTDPAFRWVQRMKVDAITGGCGATTYCPNDSVTRGDMAIFIMRGAFNQLLPAGTPILTQMSGSTLALGTTATFVITGANTNFVQGTTHLSPLPGVTIGTLTVNSPTTLTVQLTAAGNATPQPYSILVITGTEEAVLPNGLLLQ